MEKIEDELDNKSIERSPDEENITIKVEEQVDKKRTKKERSPAQIAAFEKARLKRQENYKKRQEQKTEATGPPLVGDLVDDGVTPEPRKPIKTQSTRKQALKSVDDYHDYQEPNISRQPIINNYYYGTNQYKSGNKKKSKKKVEIVEPSSDSEYTDSDEEYLPQQAKREIQKAPPTAKREKETIPQERVSLPFKFV
tara:strand:+ start:1096 stop:1683 length:588 start_codon:yes stop_codon:yes gene_type:complete